MLVSWQGEMGMIGNKQFAFCRHKGHSNPKISDSISKVSRYKNAN